MIAAAIAAKPPISLYSWRGDAKSMLVSGNLSSDRMTERVSESAYRLLNRVETAIEQSQAFLLHEQKAEGYWVGELMVDATLVADTTTRRTRPESPCASPRQRE